MGLVTKPASFGICGCTFPCLAHAHGSTCLGSECRPPEGMRFSEITACVFAGQRAEAWHFGERTGSMHAAELSPGTVRSRSRSRRVVIMDAWSRRRCHCPRHLCGLGCSAPSVMEGSGSFQSFQDSAELDMRTNHTRLSRDTSASSESFSCFRRLPGRPHGGGSGRRLDDRPGRQPLPLPVSAPAPDSSSRVLASVRKSPLVTDDIQSSRTTSSPSFDPFSLLTSRRVLSTHLGPPTPVPSQLG